MGDYSMTTGSSNLSGQMRAKVLTTEDPMNIGRIGVFIPRIMPLINNSETKEEGSETPKSLKDEYLKLDQIDSKKALEVKNFLWARPMRRWYKTSETSGGEFIVPPEGSIVIVEFIDSNPQDLFYMPYSPVDSDDPVMVESYSEDPAAVTLELLMKSLKGGAVGFDSAEGKNLFFVKMSNGSSVEIDAETNSLKLNTAEAAAEIKLTEKDIDISSNDNIRIKSKEVNVEAESVTVDASKECVVSGKSVTIETADAVIANWCPNILPQCPILMIPHGGSAAGIVNLKGKTKI